MIGVKMSLAIFVTNALERMISLLFEWTGVKKTEPGSGRNVNNLLVFQNNW